MTTLTLMMTMVFSAWEGRKKLFKNQARTQQKIQLRKVKTMSGGISMSKLQKVSRRQLQNKIKFHLPAAQRITQEAA